MSEETDSAIVESSSLQSSRESQNQTLNDETTRILEAQARAVRDQRRQAVTTLRALLTVGGLVLTAISITGVSTPIFDLQPRDGLGPWNLILGMIFVAGGLILISLVPGKFLGAPYPALSTLSPTGIERVRIISYILDRLSISEESESQEDTSIHLGPDPEDLETLFTGDSHEMTEREIIQKKIECIKYNNQVLIRNRKNLTELYQRLTDSLTYLVFGVFALWLGVTLLT